MCCSALRVGLRVGSNLQTNDLPTQLHYALFELGGGSGYVLKPPELRGQRIPPLGSEADSEADSEAQSTVADQSSVHLVADAAGADEADEANAVEAILRSGSVARGGAWPPTRSTTRRVSMRVLASYQLPTRGESRPCVSGGAHAAGMQHVPELNGEHAPPDARAAPMGVRVQVSAHAIGGLSCVAASRPPPEGAGNVFTSALAEDNGFNANFARLNTLVHCFASEPRYTILKLALLDEDDKEVAYETAVLDVLRPGYRCFHLRSPSTGMRIGLAAVFVHLEIGDEPNGLAQLRELRRIVIAQQASIQRQSTMLREQEAKLRQQKQDARRNTAMIASLEADGVEEREETREATSPAASQPAAGSAERPAQGDEAPAARHDSTRPRPPTAEANWLAQMETQSARDDVDSAQAQAGAAVAERATRTKPERVALSL